MHGNLDFNIPKCDLLLIGGDICPNFKRIPQYDCWIQENWIEDIFFDWIKKQPCKQSVFVAGNHDWYFYFTTRKPRKIPDNCCYLQDESMIYNGIKIYGSPWQVEFNDWAFNLSEIDLSQKWNQIPKDTDILLLHCPPKYILDMCDNTHIGSETLTQKIKELNCKLVVFGHNHEGNGTYEKNDTTYINASILNNQYKIAYDPIIINM